MAKRARSDVWLDRHGLQAWRAMALIREVEMRLPDLAKAGLIPGSAHPAVGMEAVAVGVSLHLSTIDMIASTHRGHAHCLAKGADPGRLLAEVLGREDGYCHGRGGSMHLGSRELGILGANGIVGAGIGIATGAALAARLAGRGAVAVAYFGDGATNQGLFHESLNLAAIWKLPCLYVCENNHYAQSSRIEEMAGVAELAERAGAYGLPVESVDGMDVRAVSEAAERSLERIRAGGGPAFLLADTYRYLGHMVGDTEIYRSRDEVEAWRRRDPLPRLEKELAELGLLQPDDLERERAAVRAAVQEAELFARESPHPAAAAALRDVYG